MSFLRRTALDLDFARPFSRGLARAQGRVLFHDCERLGRVYAGGFVHVVAQGRVILEDGVFFLPGMLTSSVVCLPGGELHIGYGAGFNYGVSIECVEYVDIGRGCMFGSLVRIADRCEGRRGPIVIGDDVWIGHGAVIEPGVTIGSGSAVSAGSVVRSDVPPGKLAIGNPARCMPLDLVTKHDSMSPPSPARPPR